MNSLSLVFERTAISAEIDEDGEPWFNANEVCAALEFGNPWQAISTHVDDEDLQKMEGLAQDGKNRQANFINESGLYSLIMGSKKPAARRFKSWVTSEVLPSIRKTGGYSDSGAQILAHVSQLKLQLDEVLEQLALKNPPVPRKDFSAQTKKFWLLTIDRCYGGMCPSGNGTRIADRDENGVPRWIKGAVDFDHWFQRDRNKKTEGWPLSKQAHKDKTRCKDGFHGKFETFQSYLKDTVIPKGVKPKDDNNIYSLFPA